MSQDDIATFLAHFRAQFNEAQQLRLQQLLTELAAATPHGLPRATRAGGSLTSLLTLLQQLPKILEIMPQLLQLITQLQDLLGKLELPGVPGTPDVPAPGDDKLPGVKRALCIGINYAGTSSQLGGCLQDADDWRTVFVGGKFQCTSLLEREATRSNILATLRSLIDQTGPNDLLVVTNSSHGTQTRDRNGDEPDGLDEAFVPIDYESAGLILDDELYAQFKGCRGRVVAIFDSCHSGTITRLFEQVPAGAQPRYLPPDMLDAGLAGTQLMLRAPAPRPVLSNVLELSGCLPNEVCYDANFSGRPNGAFTQAAIATLVQMPATATYNDWYKAIRRRLPSRQFRQNPQLACTPAFGNRKLWT